MIWEVPAGWEVLNEWLPVEPSEAAPDVRYMGRRVLAHEMPSSSSRSRLWAMLDQRLEDDVGSPGRRRCEGRLWVSQNKDGAAIEVEKNELRVYLPTSEGVLNSGDEVPRGVDATIVVDCGIYCWVYIDYSGYNDRDGYEIVEASWFVEVEADGYSSVVDQFDW